MAVKTSWKGIGMTSGAGIIFGAFPIFTTLFVQYGGDVDTFNLYGFVLTVVFLAAYIAITKRSFKLEKKAVGFVILAGLMNVVTRILLTYSYEYLDVGIATTIHFLYPLFAALLGSVFFREKMPLYKWIAFVIASASVSLFATGFRNGGQLIGIVLAASSAVCFALYMLITEKAGLTDMDPIVFVFYVSLVSALGCVGMGAVNGTLVAAIPMKALIVLLLCAIVNNVIGFALQQQGVKYMGAAMAALFSLFEPVFSCIFGALFLQQAMGGRSITGIIVILLCLAAIVLLDNRKTSC
jgi:drug/metabolite transporter (DMT)-like permease